MGSGCKYLTVRFSCGTPWGSPSGQEQQALLCLPWLWHLGNLSQQPWGCRAPCVCVLTWLWAHSSSCLAGQTHVEGSECWHPVLTESWGAWMWLWTWLEGQG